MKNVNRWALNVTAFVILLPMLRYSLPTVYNIARAYINQLLSRDAHWLVLPVVVLTFALYATSFILLLWKGRMRLSAIVAFLSFILIVFSVPILIVAGGDIGPRGLVIHEDKPGIDVYCNEVYLGETPLEISEAEFHEKVKPWNSPPRQKMMRGKEFVTEDTRQHIYVSEAEFHEKVKPRISPPRQKMTHGEEFVTENTRQHYYGLADAELRRYYVPYDYFGNQSYLDQAQFYGDHSGSKSQYWWRFEREGCTAVAAIGNRAIGERQDGRLISAHWWHPTLEYPSIRRYLAHLLHNLKRTNYQPSTEWRTHVAKASGLLFEHLYEIGKRDSRVMRALELAIQREFGIHEEMSPEEWRAVLDEVISRSKQYNSFHTLSPESVAVDLIIQHNPKLIETRFLKLVSRIINPWRVFTSGLNRSTTYRDPAEFLPLEYAVLKSRPPALFERLVYESGRGERFLSMVGNYSREESLRLVRHYLDKGISIRPSMYYGIHALPQQKAISFATHLQNPALELELRRFVLQQAQQDSGNAYHYLREFIETRLERHLTEDDAIALAECIAETVPLLEGEKLRYLIRINSNRTHRYINDILLRNPIHKMAVEESLIRQPNRSLDRLLIELYQAESAGVKFGGIVPVTVPRKVINVSRDLLRALVLCDTPRMRAFLERIWNASDANKIDLMEAIKQEAPRHFPHLHGWTKSISEIEDVDTRLAAIPTLDRIDTPESAKVLEDWALSSDAAVKEEAERALAKYHERSRKAEALLAGGIKPDDLLVDQQAYVWDGENYVPETEASED